MTESTRILIDMLLAVVTALGGVGGITHIILTRRKIGETTLSIVEYVAREAASAAWTAAKKDGLDKQKLEYDAINLAIALARRHHIVLSYGEWETLIRSALEYRYEDRTKQSNPPPTPPVQVTASAANVVATASAGGAA